MENINATQKILCKLWKSREEAARKRERKKDIFNIKQAKFPFHSCNWKKIGQYM